MAIRNGIKEELKELNLRKITLEDMMDYIDTEAPEEKEWFKKLVKEIEEANNKYNHLAVVRGFCEKFYPEKLIRKTPKRENKSKILENW